MRYGCTLWIMWGSRTATSVYKPRCFGLAWSSQALEEHLELECHHLHLLVVRGVFLEEVVHESHTQLFLLGMEENIQSSGFLD